MVADLKGVTVDVVDAVSVSVTVAIVVVVLINATKKEKEVGVATPEKLGFSRLLLLLHSWGVPVGKEISNGGPLGRVA